MLAFEPAVICYDAPSADTYPVNTCLEYDDNIRFYYSLCVMVAMAIHWMILIDLAVFSTEIAAFLLVVGHVLQEVKQFLTALTFLLLMFASSITILCRNCTDE